jgi:hypothetical protein
MAGDSLGRPEADEGSDVNERDANRAEDTADTAYERPLLTTIGSIAELTLIETMSSAVNGSKPI